MKLNVVIVSTAVKAWHDETTKGAEVQPATSSLPALYYLGKGMPRPGGTASNSGPLWYDAKHFSNVKDEVQVG